MILGSVVSVEAGRLHGAPGPRELSAKRGGVSNDFPIGKLTSWPLPGRDDYLFAFQSLNEHIY
ncbi:hypothetical protein EDD84_21825 [Burkholderia gladioli]|nr:hypothetical protein EDD84_21825 [Burkholderia gladioli]